MDFIFRYTIRQAPAYPRCTLPAFRLAALRLTALLSLMHVSPDLPLHFPCPYTSLTVNRHQRQHQADPLQGDPTSPAHRGKLLALAPPFPANLPPTNLFNCYPHHCLLPIPPLAPRFSQSSPLSPLSHPSLPSFRPLHRRAPSPTAQSRSWPRWLLASF